ncbi:MAG: tetratricopeptide repeat protein [Candidatus Omnitrophota bacterium]
MKSCMLRWRKLACILLAVAFIFIVSGCDSGEYSAEKRFWLASLKYNRLMQNYKTAKPADFQEAVNAFREITIRYPFWFNSPKAQFYIGQLSAAQNDISKARDEFSVILKDYSSDKNMCASALFAIARLYEMEGDWNKAKEALEKITKDYSGTGTAFNIPLYIAEHHKKENHVEEANSAYSYALENYKKFVLNNSDKYGSLAALDFVLTCYADQEKWQEAADYLENLIRDYSNSPLAAKSLLMQGVLYQDKLSQPQKAKENYQKVIDKYPDTLFAKSAKQLTDLINKQK